ncbi:MAG TPA: acyltransferase [Polyangiaceae bacterium]|nr:acyltransferase [Polyangiaceae bacterium]
MAYEPALDGLRGFALFGMLCFHSEFKWAIGGFLTIPTFFTLSGFLITSLFLVEWEQTKRIRLAQFWARRFRRLMPAALLTLAAMSLFGAWVADADQIARLHADVQSALFYVANWHFIFSNIAYAQLFSAPSPVQHFWSLAIEEQFYFAYALVAAFGLRLGSGSRRVFGGVLVALVALSVLSSVLLTASGSASDRIYYGSDTRAAELLLGGVAALLLHGRTIENATARRAVEWLGVVAMLAMVGIWATVPLEAQWLYYGGFAAYTLLSVLVIAAAVQPSGIVRAFLSGSVIRWIGRVSYGAYLFHWPVFLWLSKERTHLDGLPLFLLRFGVTFGLAELSYRFFESPIRSGRWLTGWRPFVATPAAFAAVVLGTSVTTACRGRGSAGTGPSPSASSSASISGEYDPTADARALEEWVAKVSSGKLRPESEADGLGPKDAPSWKRAKPRVAFYGDSTALFLGMGFQYYMSNKKDLLRIRTGVAEPGCGLARVGTYRCRNRELTRPNHCKERDVTWKEGIKTGRPDLTVAFVGPWDVCDRKLPGDDQWRAFGDPVFDEYFRKELLSASDLLLADGALVIWLTHPAIQQRDLGGKLPETPFSESDPRRMRRMNELIRELERLRPGKLKIVDLAKHMQDLPKGELDPVYRPDGTHFGLAGALKMTNNWLGPEVLRVYREAGASAGSR